MTSPRALPTSLRAARHAARSAILDGEIVASNAAGAPDFAELHRRTAALGMLHLWAFDLLALNGMDWRPDRIEKRQAASTPCWHASIARRC
jgi:ATP-dependent DNA ligase